MKKQIQSKKRKHMMDDVVQSTHDLLALAQIHHLSPKELASWIEQPANHRCLRSLCVFADLQTQLLLSRYRMLAASRLIKLATEEGQGDVARRACVDLLRLDLKRADAGDEPDVLVDAEHDLRRAIYGEESDLS